MGKVDDEDQLDEDEQEAARHPEVHPGGAEAAVRDEKGADPAPDDEEVLQAPEPVLQAGPGTNVWFLFCFWQMIVIGHCTAYVVHLKRMTGC